MSINRRENWLYWLEIGQTQEKNVSAANKTPNTHESEVFVEVQQMQQEGSVAADPIQQRNYYEGISQALRSRQVDVALPRTERSLEATRTTTAQQVARRQQSALQDHVQRIKTGREEATLFREKSMERQLRTTSHIVSTGTSPAIVRRNSLIAMRKALAQQWRQLRESRTDDETNEEKFYFDPNSEDPREFGHFIDKDFLDRGQSLTKTLKNLLDNASQGSIHKTLFDEIFNHNVLSTSPDTEKWWNTCLTGYEILLLQSLLDPTLSQEERKQILLKTIDSFYFALTELSSQLQDPVKSNVKARFEIFLDRCKTMAQSLDVDTTPFVNSTRMRIAFDPITSNLIETQIPSKYISNLQKAHNSLAFEIAEAICTERPLALSLTQVDDSVVISAGEREFIEQVNQNIAGLRLSKDGMSGCYMTDGCFLLKMDDETIGEPDNPKAAISPDLPGYLRRSDPVNERLGYLLDQETGGQSNVAMAVRVRVLVGNQVRRGSIIKWIPMLKEFFEADRDIGRLDQTSFERVVLLRAVSAEGDINEGNFVGQVRDGKFYFIPIDFGFAFRGASKPAEKAASIRLTGQAANSIQLDEKLPLSAEGRAYARSLCERFSKFEARVLKEIEREPSEIRDNIRAYFNIQRPLVAELRAVLNGSPSLTLEQALQPWRRRA